MKNCLSIASISFSLLLLFAANASALDYRTVYMVEGNNSTTLSVDGSGDYSYGINETPWAYLKLSATELNETAPLHVLWSWSDFNNPIVNETELQHYSLIGSTTDKEIWTSAPQPWWDTNKHEGKWTVDVAWLNTQGSLGVSTANFNVTPEPVSTILFLLGGAPIAMGIIRRRRQNA